MSQAFQETTVHRCFIIHTSDERANEVYEKCIKRACEASGYQPVRSEEELTRKIMKGVITSLQTAPMVIAYLGSGQPNWNPNVMIEVGYRLASGLPIVMLAETNREGKLCLPFDINQDRVVVIPKDLSGAGGIAAMLDTIKQIEAECERLQPLRSLHPIVTIQVSMEDLFSRKEWKYIAASELATAIFGIDGQLVGCTLEDFIKARRREMPPVQALKFVAEQKQLVGAVGSAFLEEDKETDGPVAVAQMPILFEKHSDPRYVGRAYMPIVINNSLIDHILELNVLYLDVTAALDRGQLDAADFKQRFPDLPERQNFYYTCKLDPNVPAVAEVVNSVNRGTVDVLLCYNRKYKEHVDAIYDLLVDEGALPWKDDKNIDFSENWPASIDAAIKTCQEVWVFIGPEPGNFQLTEINTLIAEQSKRKLTVLPVLLPGLEDWPAYIPSFFHPLNYGKYDQIKNVEWIQKRISDRLRRP
jgi:hypothetical protein